MLWKNFYKKLLIRLFVSGSLILFALSSCKYDNEEELYPQDYCDTSSVTYSNTVNVIVANKCNACHSSSAALGGVITENYNELKKVVDDGRFWGALNHENGYSPMPKGGNKLSDCELKKIQVWLDDGAPQN